MASLGRDELVAYQQQGLRPENATVVVVGDTTLSEIVPVLDRHFGDWKGSGDAPAQVTVAKVERPAAARVFLIDQPSAVQANIFAGKVAPSTKADGAVLLERQAERRVGKECGGTCRSRRVT